MSPDLTPSNVLQDAIKSKHDGKRHLVYFYGSRNYGTVPVDLILDYKENYSSFASKCKTVHFKRALEEADEEYNSLG